MRILERRNEFVYIWNTRVHKHKGHVHVSSASQKMFWMFFAYTREIHTVSVIWVKLSLEFTSGLEFEFVIHLRTRIWIRDSNLRTHVLKIRH